jgi:hypothetical protein
LTAVLITRKTMIQSGFGTPGKMPDMDSAANTYSRVGTSR